MPSAPHTLATKRHASKQLSTIHKLQTCPRAPVSNSRPSPFQMPHSCSPDGRFLALLLEMIYVFLFCQRKHIQSCLFYSNFFNCVIQTLHMRRLDLKMYPIFSHGFVTVCPPVAGSLPCLVSLQSLLWSLLVGKGPDHRAQLS